MEKEKKDNSNFKEVFQIWTPIISIIVMILIAFIVPWCQENKKIEDNITFFYRSIIANEDIYISNSNNYRIISYVSSTQMHFPESYIEYKAYDPVHELLQKKLGIINYRLLLYYLEQTHFLNTTREEMVSELLTKGLSSSSYRDAEKIYRDTTAYLEKDKLETKFNYIIDTECLLYMLHQSFDYLKLDEREKGIDCRNETLDRKFYYFGFIPADTPKWEQSKLAEAVKHRIDISNFFK